MNEFAAYYTENSVSELLVSQFHMTDVRNVLDLGAGGGSLLGAALQRWPRSHVIAAEVDPNGYKALKKQYPQIHLVKTNGLKVDRCPQLAVEPGSIDIAVCNPPYLSLNEVKSYNSLLMQAGLAQTCSLKRLTTDIIFLAQNLRMLRDGGELGIILPDSIITGRNFSQLRSDLLENHQIYGVIQMPEKVFLKTEARTHILLIRRGGINENQIPLYLAEMDMSLSKPLNVISSELFQRMDYGYWHWKKTTQQNINNQTLFSIGAEITRGNITKKECIELDFKYFHTTDFPESNKSIYFYKAENSSKRVARKGDILVARVGSRCIGKVTLVKRGSRVITDCVFRIRVSEAHQSAVIESLRSVEGQKWLLAHGHGVCAKVLSKIDLLYFPLFNNVL